MAENEKVKATLPLWKQVAYGVGSLFGDSPYANLIAYQVLFFMTDILGFNAYLSATLYSVTQWIKLLTMIAAGIIIDGWVLKWGRFRSWCIMGAVLLAVATPFNFMNFGVSTTLGVIIFMVLFTIGQLGYNIAWTAQRTLPIKMGKNTADIIALNAFSGMGMSGGAVVYSWMYTFALAKFQGNAAYTALGVLVSAFMVLCTILLAVISKPYDPPTAVVEAGEKKEKAEKVSFMDMLRSLKGPSIAYLIAFTLSNSQGGFFYALLAYFTTYVLKDASAYALALSAASILGVVGGLLQIPLVNFLGKKKDFIVCHVAMAACYVLIRYIGQNSTVFIILRGAIGFIGGLCGGLMGAYATDLADYNEMKGTSNAKAFLQSVGGSTVRIGAVISTTLAGFGLASCGYEKGVEITDKILNGILGWMAFGPAVCIMLSVIAILFFKLDEEEINAYRAKRDGQAA